MSFRTARHFPPLDQLRVFEVAARHMSFTRAAEELNVSQAAVSQRVKALETYLGAALFHRRNRHLSLTDAGHAYLPAVAEALARLDAATEQIFPRTGGKVVILRLSASLAALWLVPRLSGFYAAHPEIDLRLITHAWQPGESDASGADIEIRYDSGEPRGAGITKLMDVTVFPVCSPAFVNGRGRLHEPGDLAKVPLLHVIGYDADWGDWLKAAGVDSVDPVRGPQFDASMMALQAAEEGAGVTLGRRPLVDGKLAAGDLVQPFAGPELRKGAYYVVCDPGDRRRRRVCEFLSWLGRQTARREVG